MINKTLEISGCPDFGCPQWPTLARAFGHNIKKFKSTQITVNQASQAITFYFEAVTVFCARKFCAAVRA